jgi:hypothetical protein
MIPQYCKKIPGPPGIPDPEPSVPYIETIMPECLSIPPNANGMLRADTNGDSGGGGIHNAVKIAYVRYPAVSAVISVHSPARENTSGYYQRQTANHA